MFVRRLIIPALLLAVSAPGCRKAESTTSSLSTVPAPKAAEPPDTSKIVSPAFTLATPFKGPGWSGNYPNCVRLTADGRRLAVAAYTGFGKDVENVQVWDLAGKNQISGVKSKTGSGPLAITPDGKLLLLSAHVKPLMIVDATTGQTIKELGEPGFHVLNRIIISADGSLAVTILSDTVRGWALPSGEQRFTWPAPGGKPFHAGSALFNGGKFLATANEDGHVIIWDVAAGKPAKTFPEPKEKAHIEALCGSPDGKWLALSTGPFDGPDMGRLRIWDLTTDTLIHESKREERGPGSDPMVALPDNKTLVYTDKENNIVWFDVPTKTKTYKVAGRPGLGNRVTDMAATPDGTTLAACLEDGTIKVFDLKKMP